MYVGSTRPRELNDYIADADEGFKISNKKIDYAPAILRIFIEPLSNAIDNVSRSQKTKTPCTNIRVNIDKTTGETSVANDGQSISVEFDKDHECYNHSLIFGQLLTSSNYDDDEERYNISGRNGMGVKCTNVFSTKFTITGADPENKKLFTQEWNDNMKTAKEPVITKFTEKKGYTKVSWIPDFKQFNIKGYTDDIIALYCRYVVDASMLTGIDVYFNDVKIPVKNLKEYSRLYLSVSESESNQEEKEDDGADNEEEKSKKEEVLFINNKDEQIVLLPLNTSTTQFESVSFVNGVYTMLGGSHVDAWSEAIFRPVVQKLTTKTASYTIGDVKRYFRIFVSVKVVNPEFESQSKHKLESPVVANPKKKEIDTLLKWDVIDQIRMSKELGALKKLERKKNKFVKIEGLDSANNEGSKYSSDCTLILVEGLSAKTYAVQGIEIGAFGKEGRDWFGIYALRGKLLNVRNSKVESIAKNRVISDIIKALGISHGVDYTSDENFKTLRYGKIMIITDQDCDGFHISGLIQNMVHTLFPSLLERDRSFITSMQTPIVRVYLPNNKERMFYDEREYHKYVQDFSRTNPNKNINKKYYKGLGSSSSQDILDTFGRKMIEFKADDHLNHTMNKVFHTKETDARKDWLEKYDSTNIVLKWDEEKYETRDLNMSDFLNTEMIKFSLNDCQRSLPSLMDGLKESHRKTLFACFLKNLKYTGKTLKVAQLAGYVAEKTAYHHGEQNLYTTITKMAHEFPGSNNIPLLYRDGQFGSRMNGGADAANARYIHTKLDALTRLLFRPEDDILLDRVVDDGDEVEPVFYVPILPTILINGCEGIGSGWSSSIPSYNPLELVECVKTWLNNDGEIFLEDEDGSSVSLFPEIKPWYRGYTGEIEKVSDGKYTSWGRIVPDKATKVVEELPIGLWTDDFKDKLDTYLENKDISKFKNYSTPKKVKFVISEADGMVCNKTTLKLFTRISTTNMVMFDKNGKLKKYKNTDEIINEFCQTRFEFYTKRKKHFLGQLENELKFLGNKRRFLEEIMSGDLKLFIESPNGKRSSRPTADLYKELEKRGYDKEVKKADEKDKESDESGDEIEVNNKDAGYNYLLRLQFRNITEENITKLKNDILSKTKDRDTLKKKTEKDLWLSDLTEFTTEYNAWLKEMENEDNKGAKTKKETEKKPVVKKTKKVSEK
jgi:DNA topoisomerase-2